MELKSYDTVVAGVSEFLSKHGFKDSDCGFCSDSKAVKIEYDEEKSLCTLSFAEISDSKPGEFSVLSSWLLDASSSENDAKAVVFDFSESLEKMLGIKKATGSSEIRLPSKAAAGETPNATALCQKILAIFPQFKDVYRDHVAEYGSFLPISFFKATIIPELRKLLQLNNKKQLDKVFSMLSSMYADGDREVGNLVCLIVLDAIDSDATLYNTAIEYIDSPYLKPALEALYARAGKDKKLQSILG